MMDILRNVVYVIENDHTKRLTKDREMSDIKLSDNESTVLAEFATKNSYTFWDAGIVEGADSGTWGDVFNDEIATLCEITPRSARGVLGSMIRKGLFTSIEAEDDSGKKNTWIMLTKAGIDAIDEFRDMDLLMDEEDEEEEEPTTMIEAAAKKRSANKKELKAAAIADGKPHLRTSHANCDHATHGKEGKIARAKCRRERAAAVAAAEKAEAEVKA